MRSPPTVSSMLLRSIPHWFCASRLTRFSRLPTVPMMKPAMGRRVNTKMVNSQLTRIIIVRHAKIMIGFLNIRSRLDMMLFSTSVTSPLMRAITSPLRSLLKKPMGRVTILS